jgi:catechol 2,3-dioxygenase-like lactoylglutathione lyase family enzyme
MPTFTKLDHVQLAMPEGEERRARDFYCGVLGFEEIPKPTELAKRGGAWFRSGSVSLHLGVDRDFVAARKAHPAMRCADYDGLLSRLRRHGIEIVPDDLPFDGAEHCYIADPFGNRVELIATS